MTQPNNETQAALIRHDRLLSVADIAGTFLFAIEGATAAVTGDLDLLGLMVLAFSTALAGGITRDLLIGAVPPQSLRALPHRGIHRRRDCFLLASAF